MASRKSKILRFACRLIISSLFALAIGEIFLRLFFPQPYLFPKLAFSEKYRTKLAPSTVYEHFIPPNQRRYYSSNELGLRGPLVLAGGLNGKPNVVLLGDSYTMGMGVNDGQEWASILRAELNDEVNVINLGVGGFGLTQQIRIFYDNGLQYRPEKVILLFCGNDPADNLLTNCTRIENGEFQYYNFQDFYKGNKQVYLLNKTLGNSIIQKSALYSLVSRVVWSRSINNSIENDEEITHNSEIPLQEEYYNQLLDRFTEDLHSKNIELIFCSVNVLYNDEVTAQLKAYTHILKNVVRSDSLGLLNYVDLDDRFSIAEMKEAPDGHLDTAWHRRLGAELAKEIHASQ